MDSPPSPRSRVAVVGAGISGLACARALSRAGLGVRVFEKARGPGGRTATRRGEAGAFDHGAQYFTARDPGFEAQLADWLAASAAAPWDARLVTLHGGASVPAPARGARYVGTPRMSSLARQLSAGLELACGVRIGAIAASPGGWRLADDEGGRVGDFDQVVVATPAEQAVPLLRGAPVLAARTAEVELQPCLAVMVRFEAPLADFDGAFVEGSPLGWIARDTSKPARDAGERWVLHASPEWSKTRLEDTPEQFSAALLDALSAALGRALPGIDQCAGHRWRYARATNSLAETCLHDPALRIGACGDWCGGDRVEDAWCSGTALATRMLGSGG